MSGFFAMCLQCKRPSTLFFGIHTNTVCCVIGDSILACFAYEGILYLNQRQHCSINTTLYELYLIELSGSLCHKRLCYQGIAWDCQKRQSESGNTLSL